MLTSSAPVLGEETAPRTSGNVFLMLMDVLLACWTSGTAGALLPLSGVRSPPPSRQSIIFRLLRTSMTVPLCGCRLFLVVRTMASRVALRGDVTATAVVQGDKRMMGVRSHRQAVVMGVVLLVAPSSALMERLVSLLLRTLDTYDATAVGGGGRRTTPGPPPAVTVAVAVVAVRRARARDPPRDSGWGQSCSEGVYWRGTWIVGLWQLAATGPSAIDGLRRFLMLFNADTGNASCVHPGDCTESGSDASLDVQRAPSRPSYTELVRLLPFPRYMQQLMLPGHPLANRAQQVAFFLVWRPPSSSALCTPPPSSRSDEMRRHPAVGRSSPRPPAGGPRCSPSSSSGPVWASRCVGSPSAPGC